MQREVRFTIIGLIEIVSVIVACFVMLVIAIRGGGVWTLIWGAIMREFVRTLVIFGFLHWLLRLHFDFHEIKLVIFWILIIPFMKIGFASHCSRQFGVSINEYIKSLKHFALGTVSALVIFGIFKYSYFMYLRTVDYHLLPFVAILLVLGIVSYGLYFSTFQRGVSSFLFCI
jgi:hypothetical protein